MNDKGSLPAPGIAPPRVAWKRSVNRYEIARLLWAARSDTDPRAEGGLRVRNALARYLARTAAPAVNGNKRLKVHGRRLWETLYLMNQEHLLS